jgi:plasmid stability protein
MTRMPTLYIRNVPPEVYEALKVRAKREGRSVNAEALKILEDVAEREPPSGPELVARLWELAKEIKRSPEDPTAEEVIRILRDSGEEALERRLRGERD